MQTRVIAVLVSVQQVQDVWIIHGKQVINVAFGEQECKVTQCRSGDDNAPSIALVLCMFVTLRRKFSS